MKRMITLALLGLMALGFAATASAAIEVKMTGDARIWGNFCTTINRLEHHGHQHRRCH